MNDLIELVVVNISKHPEHLSANALGIPKEVWWERVTIFRWERSLVVNFGI